jgi:hypothetical protein
VPWLQRNRVQRPRRHCRRHHSRTRAQDVCSDIWALSCDATSDRVFASWTGSAAAALAAAASAGGSASATADGAATATATADGAATATATAADVGATATATAADVGATATATAAGGAVSACTGGAAALDCADRLQHRAGGPPDLR